MELNRIEQCITKVNERLKTLTKDEVNKLEDTATINLTDLNVILNRNSINSINCNKDFSMFIYDNFKRFETLPLANRIVLMQLIPIVLIQKPL